MNYVNKYFDFIVNYIKSLKTLETRILLRFDHMLIIIIVHDYNIV